MWELICITRSCSGLDRFGLKTELKILRLDQSEEESKNQPAWELRRQRRGCGRVQQPDSGWDEEPGDPSTLKETEMLSNLKLQVTQALQKHAC